LVRRPGEEKVAASILSLHSNQHSQLGFTQIGCPFRYWQISKIIDLLFLGRRREQHLYNNHPEFYNYLSDIDKPLELEFEKELRNKSGFKFLYCTAGEIYFFVLGWRWLIRYAQINDIEDEIHEESSSDLLSLKNGKVPDFWNSEFWKTIGEDRTPEKSIIKNFEDLRENLNKDILESEAKEFIEEAIIQWEKLIETIDTSEKNFYFHFLFE
jgi:hypothetical protein